MLSVVSVGFTIKEIEDVLSVGFTIKEIEKELVLSCDEESEESFCSAKHSKYVECSSRQIRKDEQ